MLNLWRFKNTLTNHRNSRTYQALICFILSQIFFFSPILILQASASDVSIRLSQDLGQLDWNQGEVSPPVVDTLMLGLVLTDNKGTPYPSLANQWTHDQHFLQWIFFIRPSATWSDGKPVCAQHFKDSIERIQNPNTGSYYAHLAENIRSVSTDGCHKLTLTLKKTFQFLPSLLSHWVFYPIRKDLIERKKTSSKAWWSYENLVTTGPYILINSNPGHSYTLKKRTDSSCIDLSTFLKLPKTVEFLVIENDQTAYELFQQGRLHWMKDLPFEQVPKIKSSPQFQSIASQVTYQLGFSMKRASSILPPDVRCTLAHALSREETPHVLSGFEIPLYSLNPLNTDEFKSYYESSLKNPAQPLPKKITINIYTKNIHRPLSEWIQAQWHSKLGISTDIKQHDSKSYWKMLKEEPPEVFLTGSTALYRGDDALLLDYRTNSASNFGRYENQSFDLALESGHFHKAQEILLKNDCAIAPLYMRKTLILQSNVYSDWNYTELGRFYLFNPKTFFRK